MALENNDFRIHLFDFFSFSLCFFILFHEKNVLVFVHFPPFFIFKDKGT